MIIAVLGCGPAGLMAAHGVMRAHQQWGVDIALQIFSRKRQSQMYGAQYLHAAIPGMTPNRAEIVDYRLLGTSEAYRRKVYGPHWDGAVSPEDLVGNHPAWDIRATYKRLWNTYQDAIIDVELDRAGMENIVTGRFDLIISSIPLKSICINRQHDFHSTDITAAGDAPALGINIGRMFQCAPFTVVCNGELNPAWYRLSNVYGHTTVEWPGWIKDVPVSSAQRVQKPTWTTCNCWRTVKRVGRYGMWRKGILSHHAYHDAFRLVESKLRPEVSSETRS